MSNIQIIEGDIFLSSVQAIVHQTNCMEKMGAGFAKEIRDRYPEVYTQYKKLCNMLPPQELLGGIQTIKCYDDKYIINLFGQLAYGRDKQYIDYNAFENGLNHIIEHCKINNIQTLGFPYKIGCNLAGGDWNVVYQIIEKVFNKTVLNIHVYKPN